jgi:PIN domain nuclease of toxin-antitoxin system
VVKLASRRSGRKGLIDRYVSVPAGRPRPRGTKPVKDLIDDEPQVYLSAATVWEIAVKQALGKLKEPAGLSEAIQGWGLRELPIRFDHTVAAGRLPLIHRDPFDRMLVAQARCEGLTLVTADPEVRKYDVDILAV